MTEKEPSKKSTWEKLNIAAKEDSSKSANEEKTLSTEKEEEQEKLLTHPSYKALEAQLLETENQVNELKAQLVKSEEKKLYQLAEMDNILRRTKLEIKHAPVKLFEELLPIIDSLETAIEHSKAGEQNAVLSGIQLTLKQLQNLFDKNGVKPIDPTGKPFDSHFHEAMLTEENNELDPNTIIRVLQKGYLFHERLIRPALVVVAKAKEKTS
jgi:molecular chaperone GrpE